MSSVRLWLEQAAAQGRLSPPALQFALEYAEILPNRSRCHYFFERFLLAAGALLILAGIVFFVAFNWDALHRFAKIGMVFALMSATSLATLKTGLDQPVGKALLAAAVVLIGVLLAVVGQIYQTGADSEWLFWGWAALALPWVILLKLPPLWAFWLILVNMGLFLFLIEKMSILAFFDYQWIQWISYTNLLALILAEALGRWLSSHESRFLPRFISFAVIVSITLFESLSILFESFSGAKETPPALLWGLSAHVGYLVWVLGTGAFYILFRKDIVPLALLGLSCLIVTDIFTARLLFERLMVVNHTSAFLVALQTIILTTLITFGLRALHRRWSSHQDGSS